MLVIEELHQLRSVDRRIELHRGRDGVQPAVITCVCHSAVRATSRSPVEFCLIVRLCLKPNHTAIRSSLTSAAPLCPSPFVATTITLPSAAPLCPSPFVAHLSPPATASPPTDTYVPLGLLVAYEGMSWSPAPEPAPRQRPLVAPPRQCPPVPTPRPKNPHFPSAPRPTIHPKIFFGGGGIYPWSW